MANKGGPPDLDEVFKSITSKLSKRNQTMRERNTDADRTHPFPTHDDAVTRSDAKLPRQKSKRIPFFIYIILIFILYNFGKGFFGSALEDLKALSSEATSTDSSLSAGFSVVEKIQNFLGELNMNETMGFAILLGGVVLLILFFRSFVRIVPQNEAFVVERLGKYNRTLLAGFHITIPIIERVAYRHSLKEYAIDVASQHAITRDNVVLGIDGVLYLKIMDAQAASYGIENLQFAIVQLAQTSMRAEIGKLSLDDTFESRENINAKVTQAIDEASEAWGTKVLRYEVKDITPPASILEEMEKQMGAERQRRVAVTTSEGYRQAQINEAEGDKQAQVLRAQGSAESLTIEATARAEAIRTISAAINAEGGSAAVAQQLAEQYVAAFDKLAREGTIALLPGDGSDVASMVAKAYTAFEGLKNIVGSNNPPTGTSHSNFTGS